MPVPGPRTQQRPDEGYRNPDGETPDRFRYGVFHPVAQPGRSPATMEETLRGCVLAAGQIRQLWRQAINYVAPAEPFGWTTNGGDFTYPSSKPQGITRALRYMARSLYVQGGTDSTRLSELHTVVLPRVRSKTVTVPGGAKRSAPTVRNRLTSFGSRVTPLNSPVSGAESGQ